MKQAFLFLFLIVFMCFSCSASDIAPDENKEENKTIRSLVAEKFADEKVFIGAASHYSLFGTRTMDILNQEFSYVTPSNDFKQTYIHPVPGKYQFEKSDAWIEQCQKNGQVVRLHAPISPQCSKWVKDDSRTGEDLEKMLEEYMTALCSRYNGKPGVKWLDVVNETIDKQTGDWFGPKPGTEKWENPWTIIGFDETHPLRPPLYIKQAFSIANRLASDMKLIINQHGALEKHSWEKMKKLVAYLRANNLRVDGLGWQAHIDLGWEKIPGNIDYLAEIINWCHQNNLEFHITEFNVWLKGDNAGKYKEQADTFSSIIKTVIDNRKEGIVGINFWQIRGSETANKNWDGCLFDENYQGKMAYFELIKLLQSTK